MNHPAGTRAYRIYLLWCLILLAGTAWADHHGWTVFADDRVESGSGGSGGGRGPTHK